VIGYKGSMSKSDNTIVDLPPAPSRIADDPVLRKIKAELTRLYGPRLAGVVLYGSRARGDHRPDSDIDLIALVKGYDRSRDRPAAISVMSQAMTDAGVDVSILPFPEDGLARRTIFMHNVREDGVRL
jgi:predicted nucleotidyltransferase